MVVPLSFLLACGEGGGGGGGESGAPSSGGTGQIGTGGILQGGSGGSPTAGTAGTNPGGSASGGTSGQGGSGGSLSGSGGVTGGTGPAGAGGASSGGSSAAGGDGNGGSSAGASATGGGGFGGGSAMGGRAGGGGKGGSAGSAGSSGTSGSAGAAGTGGVTPAEKTVRVFWLRPSDVPFDQKFPDGIGNVMVEAQRYYMQELGKTFRLNTPIVETVVGEHVRNWYETTPNGGDRYWWSVTNMQQELVRRFGLRNPDSRWMIVGEVHAEGQGAGGGGSPGWVILCQHDADGAAGIGGTMNRWYGGMVHELGHAFGLPDSSSTDGTPMSASFYDYPNTHFNQSQKNSILNGGQRTFLF
jgi:hypothetical protein